jgi:hypothetical protein
MAARFLILLEQMRFKGKSAKGKEGGFLLWIECHHVYHHTCKGHPHVSYGTKFFDSRREAKRARPKR